MPLRKDLESNEQGLIDKSLLLCDCGCGFEVGSESFQKLHVYGEDDCQSCKHWYISVCKKCGKDE